MEKWNPIKIKTCEEMFLGCYESLQLSETSKISGWKNVPKEIIAQGIKGYDASNYDSYEFGENLGGILYFLRTICLLLGCLLFMEKINQRRI